MAKSESEIFEEVRTLISYRCGIREREIQINSRLEKDLRVTGDDTIELLEEYSKRFDVDVSRLDVGKYAAPEGFDILMLFHNRQKGDISVSNLVEGIVKGYLDSSVIDKDGGQSGNLA
jgi:acyl carrier protein